MKQIFLLVFSILIATQNVHAQDSGRKLLHIVALKFKTSASMEEIKRVEEAFAESKGKIPGIVRIEWGTNVSHEDLDKGFSHCFVLEFRTETDRDAYLAHPEHKRFIEFLRPLLDDTFVIDFWTL